MGRILNRAGQRGRQGPAVLTTARRPHAAAGVSNGVAIRKVVAVGGSAGGIQSLCKVIEGLAPDFAAPLLAVIHMAEGGSYLAKVLERCGNIKVLVPETAEPIAAGRVYLPLPNHHLIVRDGCVGTVMGPRESRHRPAVNTLFRSVARVYRSHVIAVILSGALDDGTAGAMAVKARGGTLIVEDPATAEVPEMPLNAMDAVKPDYCLPAAEIASLLSQLVAGHAGRALPRPKRPIKRDCVATMQPLDRNIEPQGVPCPECGGFLVELGNGETRQFRCHVGHTFSLESLSEGHADALERALWVALRKLKEQRVLQQNLAQQQKDPRIRKRFDEAAIAASYDIEKLNDIISRL